MDVVSVLTCDRRPQYLFETLAALDAQGADRFDKKFLLVDGALELPPGRWWTTWQTGLNVGARRAMWQLFGKALELGADRLFYFEDDVELAPGALNAMRSVVVREDQAFVSFFDRKEFPGAKRLPPGIQDVPVMGQDRKGLHGACSMLIPRRTIEWVLQKGPFDWGDPWKMREDVADTAFTWALRTSPWRVRGVHVPSLVQHVGDVSNFGGGPGRRAARFGQ